MISLTRQRAGWYALMAGTTDVDPDLSPGRMDDGFLLVARDLSRAIAAARFSPAQHLLIQQAIELSYGRARLEKSDTPYPFKLNVSGLAKVGGFARSYLAQQHADLIACGFLVVVDGLYRINKDYRQWRDAKGDPRLSEDAVTFCRDGKIRRNQLSDIPDTVSGIPDNDGVRNTGQSVRYTRHPVRNTGQAEPVKILAPLSGIPDTHCQVYQTPSGVPPGPPIGERAPGDLEISRCFKTPVAPNGVSGTTTTDDPAPIRTPTPEPKADLSPEARVRAEVYALVLRVKPGDDVLAERVAAMAAGWSRDEGHSSGAILAALNAIMSDPQSSPRRWGTYAHRALRGMQVRSEADAAKSKARPKDLPLPPPYRPGQPAEPDRFDDPSLASFRRRAAELRNNPRTGK